MSVISSLYLDFDDSSILDKAVQVGIIHPAELYSPRFDEFTHFDSVIDFDKCDHDEWEKEKAKILEHGVINFAQKNPDGTRGVRRDYTELEIASLSLFPCHSEPDKPLELSFHANYDNGVLDDCLFYFSKAFPDTVFHAVEFCECDLCFDIFFQNGNQVNPPEHKI